MPRYLWQDKKSSKTKEVFTSPEKRDIPPTEEGEWVRIFEAPTHMRAAALDGRRKDLDDLIEAGKISTKLASMHPDDPLRPEMEKEALERRRK